MLEDVFRVFAVKVQLLDRAGDFQKHQLRRFVDAGAKVDGYASEIRHLEGDPALESRIDLRRGHVNGYTDPRPTASPLDESHKVRRNANVLQGLRQDEFAGFKAIRVHLEVIPQVAGAPE